MEKNSNGEIPQNRVKTATIGGFFCFAFITKRDSLKKSNTEFDKQYHHLNNAQSFICHWIKNNIIN